MFLVHRASPSFRSQWQGGTFLDTKQTFTRARERALLCNKHTHTHTAERENTVRRECVISLIPSVLKGFFFFPLHADTLQNNHYWPGEDAGILWCVGGPEHHTQSRPTSLGEYNYETFKPPLRSHISMSTPLLLLLLFFFLPVQTGEEEILTTPTGLCVGFFFFHPSPTFGMGCVVVACLSHFSV